MEAEVYEAPALVEFGTIEELTKQTVIDISIHVFPPDGSP
jgi:hypothetical protein